MSDQKLRDILSPNAVMSRLVKLRKRFAKCEDCAAKKAGLKHLRDATRLNDGGFPIAAEVYICAAESELRNAEMFQLRLYL